MMAGQPGVVVAMGENVAPLADLAEGAPTTILDLIKDWPTWRAAVLEAGRRASGQVSQIERWLPPLVPAKLICVGANYAEHNDEMLGQIQASFPYTFLKPPTTAVVASGDAVPTPPFGTKLDYEAELAVVMGTGGEAFGYTVMNDLSIRDWVPGTTMLGIDWLVSKGFDRSAPLGPWVVPADFVRDPQNLSLKLWVNGELRQDGNTADMVFGVQQCIDHLRGVLTLEPGDVIATGTPSGVGMRDGRYLNVGDRIRIDLQDIGTLETTIVAPATSQRGGDVSTDWLRRYYDDVDHMRLDDFIAWHSDDVRVQFGNNPPANGKEEVRENIGHFWEMISGLKHNFVTVVTDGDTTVLDAEIDYRRRDGVTVTVPCATLLHRRGELIDQVKIYADLAPVFAPAA